MPKVKTFPISTGAPPANMSFPNIKSAEPASAAPPGDAPAGGATPADAPAAEVNDGFTPEERRKN